jgi:hypothetical protein
MSAWTVDAPTKLTLDGDVHRLRVRTVSGAVNVVAAEGPPRLEVSELDGPPLQVTLEEGVLTVGYDDLGWPGFSWRSLASALEKWAGRSWKRRAVVSLAVPPDASVELGAAVADVVISGIRGRVAAHGAAGETTVVRCSGPTEVNSVSGTVHAQRVAGNLKVSTVSGDVIVAEAGDGHVRGHTVSGSVTVDLDHRGETDVEVNTVSGEVAVRIPHPADATVQIGSTSGEVSNAFDELKVSGGWGYKRVSGRLGRGHGRLRVTTVSGGVALLRRPPEPDAAEPADAPTDSPTDSEGTSA